MRLDRFFTESAICSRSKASDYIRKGSVSVDGRIVRDPSVHIDPEKQTVCLSGSPILYRKNRYLMMNKPQGVVSATEDGGKTVLDLLPENLRNAGLFPCGRLDKNTVGLMLITDNGPLAHTLLAPKSHVEKVYRFRVKFPLSAEDVGKLRSGVDIGGYVTKPCELTLSDGFNGEITLHEGKFHQIKLMMEAVHNQITFLERICFGPLKLDRSLAPGEWRYLTEDEQKMLETVGERDSNKLEQ
ncbi:MAG: pseudouridine synthase [Eubacteriales bacterium]